MLEAQKMYWNLGKAELGIQECLKALSLAQTATLHINDKSFADALRHLDELERTQLRLIDGYSFAEKLRAWIPAQVEKIREMAAKDMRDWLANVRERSELLGQQALGLAQARIESDNSSLGFVHEDAVKLKQLVEVDFDGLLASLHLFELMGRRKEFIGLLCEGRRQQLAIILEAQVVSMKDPELKSFQSLMENLAGFFIVEYYLTLLPQDVYSMPFVETLWDQALSKVDRVVNEGAAMSHSHNQQQQYLLKLKWALIFFLGAIQAYPFPSSKLYESIDALFYRFVELLKEDHGRSIEDAITKDHLEPLRITSADQHEAIKFEFLRQDPDFAEMTSLPFASSLCQVYDVIVRFSDLFSTFLEGIHQRTGELDEIARKAIDMHMLREASRLYVERAKTAELRQLMVIYSTLSCLEKILPDITRLLAQKGNSKNIKLQAQTYFASAKTEVVQVIQNKLRIGLSGVMESYKLVNKTPDTKPTGPSEGIQNIVTFVGQTRTLLGDQIEPSVFELVFGFLFKAIAAGLLGTLTDPSIPSINLEYMEGFKNDLEFLLEALTHHALNLETFAELQEIVSLALSPSCHEYMDPIVRQREYSHLRSEIVVPFLAKIAPKFNAKRLSIEDLIMLLGRQQL